MGFPGGEENPPANAGHMRHEFNPWVGKIPWRSTVDLDSDSLFCFVFLIYLALLGLSCSTWDLYLQYVGSSSLTRDRTQVPCIRSAKF